MYRQKNIVVFGSVALVALSSTMILDQYLPPMCSADDRGIFFVIRLLTYCAVPITLHIFVYSLFCPQLASTRILIVASIMLGSVALPFFALTWASIWVMSWDLFSTLSFWGFGYGVFVLAPPTIFAIWLTLRMLKMPFLEDVSGGWGVMGQSIFLIFMALTISGLAMAQSITTIGCL